MSKKISAFKNMCQEDQVALLKGGCTEMMLLRSVMQYDSEASGWKILHSHSKEATTSNSNLRADILKLAGGPVYEEHERFILTFEPKWRQDENIILIMCAIILFTHDRPKTIHSDVIKLEQVRSETRMCPRESFNFSSLFRIHITTCCDGTWRASTRAVKPSLHLCD